MDNNEIDKIIEHFLDITDKYQNEHLIDLEKTLQDIPTINNILSLLWTYLPDDTAITLARIMSFLNAKLNKKDFSIALTGIIASLALTIKHTQKEPVKTWLQDLFTLHNN